MGGSAGIGSPDRASVIKAQGSGMAGVGQFITDPTHAKTGRPPGAIATGSAWLSDADYTQNRVRITPTLHTQEGPKTVRAAGQARLSVVVLAVAQGQAFGQVVGVGRLGQ